jgi:hypothetical protein
MEFHIFEERGHASSGNVPIRMDTTNAFPYGTGEKQLTDIESRSLFGAESGC